jgi:hypothetical protein
MNNIEELKRLAEAANKAHGGLPWQVTMTRTDGGTCYSIRGHSEPGIAVDRSDYWEDDHHPPVDHFGYIQPDYYMDCSPARVDIARHIAAANPAAVLELIDYIDYLRGKNREHFDACIGCDEELKRVTKQRNELLAALKDARRELAYAGRQEAHDAASAAIAKAEG